MYCYEIWVRSNKYHNKLPLSYTSMSMLEPGTIVKVDLRNTETLGIVRRQAVAPKGISMKPIIGILSDNKSQIIPKEILMLFSWFLQYYPAGSGVICQMILPSRWTKPDENSLIIASNTKNKLLVMPPKLTKEQTRALSEIENNSGSFLLHGETGSGKTRVYLELIKKNLEKNKSCLILVPEIGLIAHLYEQLSRYLNPNIIKSFHSNLTSKQHNQIWFEILQSTSPLVIIGPRSALFLPLKNIGLVVVDECHDDGYNQTNTPIYSGLRVASKLAVLHNSTLIFGSATPSITDYFIAQQKNIPIIRMKELATKGTVSKVKKIIVNKLDRTEFTRSKVLSTSLLEQISSSLKLNQQILLFLNRRGSAKVVACRNCGWQALCKNCNLNLTFHEDTYRLTCHTCGYNTKPPSSCPDCKNPEIIFSGPGTKSIETEIKKLYPNARVNRFDSDNLTSEKLTTKLKTITSGNIDIIIGTQILVKGFDIPKLSLVGIIDADTNMSLPDFATEETSYQLLSQAVGRVGRGHTTGTVVMQSLQPNSQLLRQAISKDWDSFYESQLSQRQQFNFPPFTFLLKLECSRKQRNTVINASNNLKKILLNNYSNNIKILGPAPSFKEKYKNTYTWQIIVKSSRRSILLKIIDNLPSGWRYFLDPSHLL